MQIENIKEIMDNLDLGALFPSMESVSAALLWLCRVLVMAGPLALLALGLYYFLAAPKEANYKAGYRIRWGMGSVEAWQYTQRLAGLVLGGLGLVLTIVFSILTAQFAAGDPSEVVWQALVCLSVEVVLVAAACFGVNITVFSRFDRSGNRRLSWKELTKGS